MNAKELFHIEVFKRYTAMGDEDCDIEWMNYCPYYVAFGYEKRISIVKSCKTCRSFIGIDHRSASCPCSAFLDRIYDKKERHANLTKDNFMSAVVETERLIEREEL